MQNVSGITHKQIIVFCCCLTLMSLLFGLGQPVIAQGDAPTTTGIYLPLVTKANSTSTATPTPTATPTTAPTPTPSATPTAPAPTNPPPAALVSTWFAGNAPLNDFYNPQTGEWRDANGLGQMYVFAADGSYTYTGFLRLQNGQCRSEVSVYKQGTVSVQDATLVLHQIMGKTRTVVICPTPQETITEETTATITLGWEVAYDNSGHQQLTITENDKPTVYNRQGMEPTLVGGWRRGEIASAGFYDAAANTFAPEPGEGTWYRFAADGQYQFGEFGYGQDNAGCRLSGWVYQEGTLDITSGRLTTTPTSGMARVENECHPDQARQEAWLDPVKEYAWIFRDRTTEPKLVLMPLGRFEEIIFTQE